MTTKKTMFVYYLFVLSFCFCFIFKEKNHHDELTTSIALIKITPEFGAGPTQLIIKIQECTEKAVLFIFAPAGFRHVTLNNYRFLYLI